MNDDLPFKIDAVAELPGHDDRAWHVAWNPTKPLLASCSADKTVRIYNYIPPADGQDACKFTFSHLTTIPTGHSKTVRAIAWSPSGETLATGSFDANIGIWEQEMGGEGGGGEWECTCLLEGHETECKSVAYSSSGTLLASCSRDKTVWLWEVHPDSDFECLSVLMEHTQDVKCVAWHPTEEILASASYDDTIRLYVDDPVDDWFCFSTLTGHTSTVWSLAWAPGGRYLASASDDHTVRVWKRTAEHSWESVLVLEGHERAVYSVSWSAGKGSCCGEGEVSLGWLASTGSDGTINVWELSESLEGAKTASPPSHKLIARLTCAHGVYDLNAISWCPRKGLEDLLATTSDDGSVRVWRVSPANR